MSNLRAFGAAPEGVVWRMNLEKIRMIRIGANPIGWSNDDMLEIGGNIPLEQCLEEAKAAGFAGMELGNKFPRNSEQLRPILEKFGHALVGGWYSTELLTRSVTTRSRPPGTMPRS